MRRHLGNHHGCGDGVLIADIVAHHVAVALLKGKYILVAARGFPLGDTLGHELEARKGVLKVDAVRLADRSGHAGGNDACYRARVLWHGAGGLLRLDDIVEQEYAHLVAGYGDIFVAAANHGADTVGIWVGSDYQIASDLLCKVDREVEALRIFGVRAGNGREAAVDDHLLRHGVEMLYSQAVQHFGDELIAAAVERRVDDLEFVRNVGDGLLVDSHPEHLLHEQFVGLFAEYLDPAGLYGFVVIAGLEAREHVNGFHLLCNGLSLLRRELRPVGPVDLIAVIFLGVVAGGDIESGCSAVMQDGEAQLRSRAQGLEQAHADAVCSHDAGGLLGEAAAVYAAVMRDGNAALGRVHSLFENDVCKRLSRVADNMDIHVVQAELHRAAETGGAELKRGEETALYLFFVARYGIEFLPFLFAESGAVKPVLILFFVISHLLQLLLHCKAPQHLRTWIWAQVYPRPGRSYLGSACRSRRLRDKLSGTGYRMPQAYLF